MASKVKGPDETFCESCGAVIKLQAELCPKCGVRRKPAPTASGGQMAKQSLPQDGELPSYLGYPAIGCLMILFWPLGLYLLVMRMRRDRSLQMASGQTLYIAGLVIGGVFALAAIVAIGDPKSPPGAFIVLVVLAAGGFFLARKGANTKKLAAATRRYIDIVVNQKQSSVDNVASIVGNSDVQKVMRDLQDQIDAGFLKGYSIDWTTREITRHVAAATNSTPSGPPVVFSCKACGAQNEVSNTNSSIKCDYCDSPHKM